MTERIADNVQHVIRDVAETIVCPFFCNLDQDAISTKTSPDDYVTIADIKSEAFLTKNLSQIIPNSLVLGEEEAFNSPNTRKCLDTDAPVWVIDPIDGTANFAKGSPIFGIIVSLVYKQQTVAGWMFDPLQDRMFFARRGEGVLRNDVALSQKPNEDRPLSSMTGCMGRRPAKPFQDVFKTLLKSGCSAHDYMAMCEGHMDFRYFKSLYPWDHAAGVLMVEEMGGTARLMSGEHYSPIFHKSQTMLVTKKTCEWDPIQQVLVA